MPSDWDAQFDAHFKQLWGCDPDDAGIDESDRKRICDMPPREAALWWGDKYNLVRMDEPYMPG